MIRFCKYCDGIQNSDETEYVVFNETLFEQAHKILESRELPANKNRYLQVLNEEGQPVCFCYEDKSAEGRYLFYKETIDCLCRENKIDDLIKRCGKIYEAVHIQDMNELAYGLYNLCIQHEIPVHTSGSGWGILKENKSIELDKLPEKAWMFVPAEGEKERDKPLKCVEKSFRFLMKMGIGRGARRYLLEEIKKCYANHINNIIAVSIPHAWQLSVLTEAQKKCIGLLPQDVPKHIREEIFGEKTVTYFGDGKNNFVDDSLDQYLFSGKEGVPAYKFYGTNGKRRLYIIGPCIVFGRGCLAEESFPYQIQMRVKDNDYVVIKIGIDNVDLPAKIRICEQLPLREQDILLFVNTHQHFDTYTNREVPLSYKGIPYIDTLELFEDSAGKEILYSDAPPHTNLLGNQRLADYIYKKGLKSLIERTMECPTNHYLQYGEPIDEGTKREVEVYIEKIRKEYVKTQEPGIKGSIVMNCNPFTKGHRYLIETAARQVDVLYIFVVEEDKSRFSFQERFDLVKAGTENIKNVRVIPSGRFVLSYETLPLYFSKSENKTAQLDASMDLELFSRLIAPALGITVRFAGEEPCDLVTRQYNEQMAEILPEFGIEFREIPRILIGDTVVSASEVRKLLDAGKWEMLEKYVPYSTYSYLQKQKK